MLRPALLVGALALVACGPVKPKPDAGTVDTSCGLDCAMQQKFGLIVGTCFEYSNTNSGQDPASLGVEVLDVFTLEGDVKVIPLQYTELGQTRMRDSFAFVDGELRLMRREYAGGSSVTWKDSNNNIVGVGWLRANIGSGESIEATRTATTVMGGGSGTDSSATHRVSVNTASSSDTTIPRANPDGGTYSEALSMLFNSAPATDNRRIYVPDLGFIGFSNTFVLGGSGTAVPYKLQKIRDVKGSSTLCGFGAP